MTDEEMAVIRQRHQAATRGFWLQGERTATLQSHDQEGTVLVATITADRPTDVEALAHSWSDVDKLVAEVERLRKADTQQSEWIAALMDEQSRYANANARLISENAVMREIVAAVAGDADEDDTVFSLETVAPIWICAFCTSTFPSDKDKRDFKHSLDCPVTKARALLAFDAKGVALRCTE